MSAPVSQGARILNFAWIGAIGFAVDAGVLQVLFSTHTLQPLYARAISFPLAVTATWILNSRFTFKDRPASQRGSRYGLYFLGQTVGALLNFGVFALLILFAPVLSRYPVVPLAVGSGCAMTFNYLWAQLFVFPANSIEKGFECEN